MKSVNLYNPKELKIEEEKEPALEEGTAIVKIEYCGICGSDLSAYQGLNPTVRYPIIGLGHEGVGYVSQIGENEQGLKAGDKVALEPYIPCLKCHRCEKEEFNNCCDIHVAGVHTDGMMKNYVKHPLRLLHKIPDELTLEEAVLTEPFTIGLHGATRAGVKSGDVCLVFGAGMIGLMAAFAAKNYGGTPIVVDVLQKRLDAAKEMGFEVCNSNEENLLQYLTERTEGRLADVVIDCTGSPYVIKNLHLYVAYGARVTLVGWPHEPVELNTVKLTQREVTVYTSRNSNKKFPEALRLVQKHFLPADKLISEITDVDDIEITLKKIIADPSNYLKVVVSMK